MNWINTTSNKLKERYKSMNVAVKASLWFALCSIIQKGISVFTLPIFTRIMSTYDYGKYNVFLTWYNLFTIIVTLNIQSEIFNKGLITHLEDKDDYTTNQLGLLLTLSVIFFLIYFVFHNYINSIIKLSTGLVIIMFAEIFANAVISLWSVRKRFEFDYLKFVKLTLAISLLNPIIGFFAVTYSEKKAVARIMSGAFVAVVFALLLLFFMVRKAKFNWNLSWWKVTIMNCLPLLPHYLSLVLLNQSDKLMIDYFVGPDEAGIYSVAHSAGLLMTIINTSINGSFVPWIYNRIKTNNLNNIKKLTNSLMWIVLIVNLIIVWLAPELIYVLASEKYAVAIWCLAPISISVFYFFVYTLFVDIEIFYGGNKYIAVASVIAAVSNIVLNYIFIPIFGYVAAGYTTLFCYFLTMVLHYIFMRVILKKHSVQQSFFDGKTIAIMSVVLLIIAALAVLLYNFSCIYRVIIVLLVAGLIVIKKEKIISVLNSLKNKPEE